MRSDRPCRPVIDVVLLMTAAKVALVGDTAGLALFIVPDGVSSAPVRSAAHPHLVGDGLPPPDLVIAHQVLLI
jgi:hypothetical protein